MNRAGVLAALAAMVGGLLAVDVASARYVDGMNLYSYVKSSPPGSADPDGRENMAFGNGVVIYSDGSADIDMSTTDGYQGMGYVQQLEGEVARYNRHGPDGLRQDVAALAAACGNKCPDVKKCCDCTEEICRKEAHQIVEQYAKAVNDERRARNLGFWSTGLPGNIIKVFGADTLSCGDWQFLVHRAVRRRSSGKKWKCWRAYKVDDYYWYKYTPGKGWGKDGHGFVGLYHCCNNDKHSPDAVLDPWRDGLPYVFGAGEHSGDTDRVHGFRTNK